MRLPAFVLLGALLWGAAVGATGAPSPAASTTAERHAVVADDGHALVLWSKAPPSPRGAILLLHGRTWSALPNFDLQVAATPRSVMDALVYAGYAVYALDQRGYGASPRDASGWLTPTRASADALAAARVISGRHPGLPAPVLVGYSMGSVTALFTVQQQPEAFSKLVLYGFPVDPAGVQLRKHEPSAPAPARAATTAAAAGEDFVVAGASPQAVVDAYVAQAVAADPVRVDWKNLHEFRLDPANVTTPTLLLQGVGDGYVQPDAVARLFNGLATPDRSWVVLPDSDHAAHVEDAMPAWISAIVHFIERPRPAVHRRAIAR
jgi:alpha-beta hydrolase superfamily lysophospholipase